MNTQKYIIQDWAGNILHHDGTFKASILAVPMEFETFEDGWSWIVENVDDEDAYQDLFVEELENECN